MKMFDSKPASACGSNEIRTDLKAPTGWQDCRRLYGTGPSTASVERRIPLLLLRMPSDGSNILNDEFTKNEMFCKAMKALTIAKVSTTPEVFAFTDNFAHVPNIPVVQLET